MLKISRVSFAIFAAILRALPPERLEQSMGGGVFSKDGQGTVFKFDARHRVVVAVYGRATKKGGFCVYAEPCLFVARKKRGSPLATPSWRKLHRP